MKTGNKPFIVKLFCLGMAVLFSASIVLLAFTSDADAERRRSAAPPPPPAGCTQNAGVVCVPALLSTGCVEITNKHSRQVGFIVTPLGSKSSSAQINFETMGAGQSRKADFGHTFTVDQCIEKRDNGEWYKINCDSVLKVGENRNSGGGCGCQFFRCLADTILEEKYIHKP